LRHTGSATPLQVQRRFTKLDPVCGRDARIEFQVEQPAAELCLADPAVAEQENLQRRVLARVVLEISVVGADFIQDVFVFTFAVDFRGQIIQLATKQAKFLQRWQQGFERSKLTEAVGEVEVLE